MANEGAPTLQPQTRAQLLAALTGAATLAAGAMLYGVGTSQPATLTIGAANRFLQSNGSAPQWVDLYGTANTWTAVQTISAATASTSTTTGALVVTGGVGIGGAGWFGGNVTLAGSAPTLALSTSSNTVASLSFTTGGTLRGQWDADNSSVRLTVAGSQRLIFPIGSAQAQVPVSLLAGTSGTAPASPLVASLSAWPTAIPTAGQGGLHLGLTAEASASYRTITAGYCSGATNLPCAFGYVQTSSGGFTTGDFIVAVRNGTSDVAPTITLRATSGGSLVLGSGALSTSATDGFIYVATCAGAPTGVPTANTGRVALTYDTTNNKLYAYNGAWKSVTLA